MTRPTSIRKRLFYQLAIVAAVLSLAFVMVVRGVASRAAEGTQDDILAASATAIADSLSSEQGEVTLELPYSALSMLGTINEDRVFYRVTVEGETLTGYPDLPVSNLPTRIDTPAFSTEFYRGDEVRLSSILRRVSNTATGSRVVVTVAQTRSGLAAITQRITITATGVGLLFFLLATTLSLLAANSALRPLRRMTGAVTRRGPSDLRPVTAETPAEPPPLVDALNSFIGEEFGYRAYLVNGKDTSTGQNVGLLTRIDPADDVRRTEARADFPLPVGTPCHASSLQCTADGRAGQRLRHYLGGRRRRPGARAPPVRAVGAARV